MAKWQDRLHGIWLRFGHGCNCNRPTPDLIEASPLQVERLERGEMPKAPPVVRPLATGSATLARVAARQAAVAAKPWKAAGSARSWTATTTRASCWRTQLAGVPRHPAAVPGALAAGSPRPLGDARRPSRRADPELFGNARLLARAMETGLGAEGSFVAINNRVSQSVPHLHVHVVPRTKGDGLRGFFWPRQKYRDDAHAAETQQRSNGPSSTCELDDLVPKLSRRRTPTSPPRACSRPARAKRAARLRAAGAPSPPGGRPLEELRQAIRRTGSRCFRPSACCRTRRSTRRRRWRSGRHHAGRFSPTSAGPRDYRCAEEDEGRTRTPTWPPPAG